jgi:hypothetical protein
MNRIVHSLAFFVFFFPLLSACTSPQQPLPATETPPGTEEFLPEIALPVEPISLLGDIMIAEEGGYAFRPPVDYEMSMEGNQVTFSNEDESLLIPLFGTIDGPENATPERIAASFLDAFFQTGGGEYTIEDSYPITVDGVEGLAYELTGTTGLGAVRGKAVAFVPGETQFFFGMGLSFRDDALWENEGSAVFDALIHSITFITPTDTCTISTDDTYGYTKENPIRVGGNEWDGPARERAYLDILLGPEGRQISYDRQGSIDFGNTILDVYKVNVGFKTHTLYIDEYSYSTPQAPVGFTCDSAFPFGEP